MTTYSKPGRGTIDVQSSAWEKEMLARLKDEMHLAFTFIGQARKYDTNKGEYYQSSMNQQTLEQLPPIMRC